METPPPISKKQLRELMDKNLPPPASVFFRLLAFCADTILLYLVIIAESRILIPSICEREFSTAVPLLENFCTEYENLVASGDVVSLQNFLQSAVPALANNENITSLFSAIAATAFTTAFVYFMFSEFFMHGETLGKKIFHIRTISQTGTAPNFLQCFSRAIWKACSIAPWGLLITIVMIINAYVPFFSYRKRAWHDMIARTDVVDSNNSEQQPRDEKEE